MCTEKAGNRKNKKSRWGDFYYYVIELNNNKIIIITSLMMDESNVHINNFIIKLEPQGNAEIDFEDERVVNLELIK